MFNVVYIDYAEVIDWSDASHGACVWRFASPIERHVGCAAHRLFQFREQAGIIDSITFQQEAARQGKERE